jgi:LysM repeat protein
VAPKPTTSPGQPEAAPKTVHVVKSGESLGSIATKYHCTVAQLMKWNNLKEQKILVGQKIKVVSDGTGTASNGKPEPNSKPKTTPSGSTKFTYYTILAGDNLWDIAAKFDVTVSQLKSINKFKNNSRLTPGQKIKIPR